MSNPTGHDKQPIGNDKPDGNHKPDDLAALDSDAETGSAHDPKNGSPTTSTTSPRACSRR
jgi:hypothetical protein